MKRSACYLLACVALFLGFVVVPGVLGTASAAQLATTGTVANGTDKVRCAANYTTAGSNTTVRMRCYFDVWTAWHTYWAGTDLSASSFGAPLYNLMPYGTGCTMGYAPNTFAIGPQIASQSQSGVAIPDRALEATYLLTGASCVPPATGVTSGAVWMVRLFTPGGDKQAFCSSASLCTMVSGLGWPAYPADWFPGGSVGGTPPFCGATVSSTTHLASSLVSNGDVVTFSTSWTSARTRDVQMRWPGEIGWRNIMTAGTFVNPSVLNVTVRQPGFSGWIPILMSNVEIRCYDDLLAQYFYSKFGAAVADAGDGRARPCDLARLYWPANKYLAVSDVATWQYQYSGLVTTSASVTTLSIDSANFDVEAGARVPPMSSLTWTNRVSNAVLGSSGSISLTAGFAGPITQFVLRCTDYLGTTYGQQWTSGVRLVSNGDILSPEDAEAACYANTGLGLSPSSWVPGLARMISCALRSLFVPSDASVESFKAAWTSLMAKPPLVFIAEGMTLFTSFWGNAATSATAASGGCLTLLPASSVNGNAMASGEMCPSTLGAVSQVSTAKSFLNLLVWALWIWGTFMFIRKVVFKS